MKFWGKLITLNQSQAPLFSKLVEGLGWLLFFVPMAIYGWFVWKYSINIPYWDDFDILANVISFVSTNNWLQKLQIIFTQANEHRVITAKIVFLIQYYLSGASNFRYVNIFANLVWVFSVLFVAYQFRPRGKKINPWILLPVPYFLFNLAANESATWAMGSAPYFLADLFIFLFLFFLIKDNWKWTYVCLACAIFSFGSGLALIPVGVFYLLYKRKWKSLGWFLVYAFIIFCVYFIGLKTPSTGKAVTSITSLLPVAGLNLVQFTQFFFTFIGSLFQVLSPVLTTTIGALIFGPILIFFLAYLITPKPEADFPVWLFITILLADGLAAATRSQLGALSALVPKYIPYSGILLASAYAMLFSLRHENSKRIALFLAIVISIALFWVGFFNQGFVAVYKNNQYQKINAISGFEKFGDAASLIDIYPAAIHASNILKAARVAGIYQFHPTSVLSPEIYSIKGKNKQELSGMVDYFSGGKIIGWAILPNINSAQSNIWLILKSKSKLLRLKISRLPRPDVSDFYHVGTLYNSSGYEGFINNYDIPSGKYAIGILVENGEESGVLWTSHEYDAP